MISIKGTIKARRLELDAPTDWPDGTEVEIHPIGAGVGFAVPKSADQSKVDDWPKWFGKLARLQHDEWDSAAFDKPAIDTIQKAREFLDVARTEEFAPSQLSPSIVGGVGVTFKTRERRAYVEFRNTGTVHALYSDGIADPMVEKIIPDRESYLALINRVKQYLHE